MSLRFSLALLLLVAMSQLWQQVDGRKKLCGDALNEALDLICVNGFSRRIKRDSDRSPRTPEQALRRKWHLLALRQQLDGTTDQPVPAGGLEDRHLINEPDGATRELRRPRRRITHECCKQGCSYDDILEYCA
ncbi:probable insulin-like peptide 4 [Drosophila montana]|uniref:probable insulin-like peptide 4 n=1 Tax=Drosophila montana TaxID=40370 RepID=UPI00313E2FC3